MRYLGFQEVKQFTQVHKEVMIVLEQELFSELLVQCFFYFGHIQGPGTICQAFCKLQQYSRILPLLDFNCQCIKVHDMCW